MPRRITTPWLREIYESAAASPATPSDGAHPLTGDHAAGVVATQSPAVLAAPGGVTATAHRPAGDAALHSPARPSAPIPEGGVSPFARMVLSISQRTGCSVEEARDHARLQLARSNSPSLAAPTAGQGNTHFPNPVPYRIGSAPRLLRAAQSRDLQGLPHTHKHEESAR